jgi:hypothetical protein
MHVESAIIYLEGERMGGILYVIRVVVNKYLFKMIEQDLSVVKMLLSPHGKSKNGKFPGWIICANLIQQSYFE